MRTRSKLGILGSLSAISLALVAMACGDNIAPLVDPVYVDADAAEGGDGTQGHPFQRFSQALEVAVPDGLIIVGPGLYEVPSEFQFDRDLSILGSISTPTLFVGDTSEERVRWQADSGVKLFVRDVDFEVALELGGGKVELEGVGVTGIGPTLSFRAIEASASALSVSVSEAGEGDHAGDAVVASNATLSWEGGGSTGALDRALVAEASTVSLASLHLSGRGRGAIHAVSESAVEATGLTLEDSFMAAFVLASTLTLSDSSVARSWQSAILVGSGGTATVRDSDFEDCDAGFIASSAGSLSLTVEGSTFSGALYDYCITSASQTMRAIGNSIETCAGAGLLVLDGQDIEVRDNQIQDIHYDTIIGVVASGIDLSGVTGVVTGNTIKSTLNAGVSISHSTLRVDSNTIGPVGGSGISYVNGPSDVTTVTGNVIADARGVGIAAFGATVDITNNEVSATKVSQDGFADGIVFGTGAMVNATGNTLTGNAHNGVLFLDGAQGSVSGNTASGNLEYGIRELCVGSANSVTVGANTLAGNTQGEQTLCSP